MPELALALASSSGLDYECFTNKLLSPTAIELVEYALTAFPAQVIQDCIDKSNLSNSRPVGKLNLATIAIHHAIYDTDQDGNIVISKDASQDTLISAASLNAAVIAEHLNQASPTDVVSEEQAKAYFTPEIAASLRRVMSDINAALSGLKKSLGSQLHLSEDSSKIASYRAYVSLVKTQCEFTKVEAGGNKVCLGDLTQQEEATCIQTCVVELTKK